MTTVGKILRKTTLAGPDWNQASNDGSHLSPVCTGTTCWGWFVCSRLFRYRRVETQPARVHYSRSRLVRHAGGKKTLERNWGIYTSSRDIEIQLHIPVMYDRISRRVCVRADIIVCLKGLVSTVELNARVCVSFRVHCAMEWPFLLSLGHWVSHHS